MLLKFKQHIWNMQGLSSFSGAVAAIKFAIMFVKINIDYENTILDVANPSLERPRIAPCRITGYEDAFGRRPHPTRRCRKEENGSRNGKPRGGLFVVCILLEWITRSINRKACPNGVPGDGPFYGRRRKKFLNKNCSTMRQSNNSENERDERREDGRSKPGGNNPEGHNQFTNNSSSHSSSGRSSSSSRGESSRGEGSSSRSERGESSSSRGESGRGEGSSSRSERGESSSSRGENSRGSHNNNPEGHNQFTKNNSGSRSSR